jgi:hypothetical protein
MDLPQVARPNVLAFSGERERQWTASSARETTDRMSANASEPPIDPGSVGTGRHAATHRSPWARHRLREFGRKGLGSRLDKKSCRNACGRSGLPSRSNRSQLTIARCSANRSPLGGGGSCAAKEHRSIRVCRLHWRVRQRWFETALITRRPSAAARARAASRSMRQISYSPAVAERWRRRAARRRTPRRQRRKECLS